MPSKEEAILHRLLTLREERMDDEEIIRYHSSLNKKEIRLKLKELKKQYKLDIKYETKELRKSSPNWFRRLFY